MGLSSFATVIVKAGAPEQNFTTNESSEIQEISIAAMTKLAMHFTASSYCSALDLNDGDVVLVELWNYQTSDEHAPMACDRGQLDLTIPSNNRNGFIQSR